MIGLLSFAFVAGTVATANPCGFALLPAFLARQLRTSDETRAAALVRAFAVGGVTTAGFLIVFGTIGTALALGGRWLTQVLPWAALAIGIALIGAGLAVLLGRHIGVTAASRLRPSEGVGYRSAFVFGVGYGLASLSCTLPVFLVVIAATVATAAPAAPLAFTAYALGMGTILTALAVAAALSRTAVQARLRRALPYLNPLSGLLLLAAGAYVVYYFAFALLPAASRTPTAATPIDAVSRFASQVQTWLDGSTGRTVTAALVGALAVLGLSLLGRAVTRRDAGLPDTPSRIDAAAQGATASFASPTVRARGAGDADHTLAKESTIENRDCCAPASSARPTAESGQRAEGAPLVEILYFDGCPNHEPALVLVERVARELGLEPEVTLVRVPDAAAAQRRHFLGSPTIRVDGRDVDPQTAERTDYALSCRVFRTASGFSGQPDEQWVREALLRAATAPA